MTHKVSHHSRRGFTIVELVGALVLLGIATGVMMSLMLSVAAQRRAAEQRQAALIHAENLLDEFLSRSWNDVTQDALSQVVAGDEVSQLPMPLDLPEFVRTVTVTERPEDAARQITVELLWRNRAGQMASPVRLSGWKFAPVEAVP